MWPWFHFNYPTFWNDYAKNFSEKPFAQIKDTRFVVLDTETTGLNKLKDRILSIGAIGVTNNIIAVSDSFEIYIKQEEFNSDTVKIHGILKDGRLVKTTEYEALEQFLTYLKNAVIVAHHAGFDIDMINTTLKRYKLPKLKNKVIDTGVLYKKLEGKKNAHFSLDVLSREFKIPMNDRHTASGDAYITAQLFLKILSRLKQERQVDFSDLFRNNNKRGLL